MLFSKCGEVRLFLMGMNRGSTFKILTAAIAIEEGLTTADNAGEFSCTRGYRDCR